MLPYIIASKSYKINNFSCVFCIKRSLYKNRFTITPQWTGGRLKPQIPSLILYEQIPFVGKRVSIFLDDTAFILKYLMGLIFMMMPQA
jgi:hypothetical protein